MDAPNMPKIVFPLSERQVKNAKPKDKPYKFADGGGLYIEIMPIGTKLWRMKFRQATGKESRLSFGKYPEVTIAQARAQRDAGRKLKAEDADPGEAKRERTRVTAEKMANRRQANTLQDGCHKSACRSRSSWMRSTKARSPAGSCLPGG